MRNSNNQNNGHYCQCHDCENERRNKKYHNHKDDHDGNKKESAFRAVNTQEQEVDANVSVQVCFDREEFDLGREFEPGPSVFESRRDGVYLLTATVGFEPDSFRENYRARVEFRINNQPFEAADNDFWGKGVRFTNAVQATAILKLRAGDEVTVFMTSSVPGRIPPSVAGSEVNAFSAARLVDLH